MTPLSPTPLTPRCKECGTALELPGVAAEPERLERSLSERDARIAAYGAALQFAQRAIEDAIYCEDGLDGDAGQRVIHIITEALTRGTFDEVEYGALPKTMMELECAALSARNEALVRTLTDAELTLRILGMGPLEPEDQSTASKAAEKCYITLAAYTEKKEGGA